MPIVANDAIRKFGTLVSLDDGSTASIANGQYSTSADVAIWTNAEDAVYASFVLTMQYASGTVTTGGISLSVQLLDGNGTIDEPPISNNWLGHWLGSFVTGPGMVAATNYALVLENVELPVLNTNQQYQFAFKNDSGVSISVNWQFDVRPTAIGPKP